MRPPLLVRMFMFVSSYFPLFLIFGFLLWDRYWVLALSVVGVGCVGLGITLGYLLWARSGKKPNRDMVKEVEQRDNEVMGYIATYLIPFVSFDMTKLGQQAALVVFILVLLVVYVNSNMIYIHPVLNIFGFHLYAVKIEHSVGRSHFYIARKPPVSGEEITFVRITDDFFLEC